jgi:peptidoglycan/xylan/chitin deacetylase (PgdA/CDA1 family)
MAFTLSRLKINYINCILFAVIILIFHGCKANKSNKETINIDSPFEYTKGAITRGDTTKRDIALVFTGDSFAEGAESINTILRNHKIQASFFFTGNFYRNEAFAANIETLIKDSHFLGAHSDQHLLYCDWNNRDSLLVTRDEFRIDVLNNYKALNEFGVTSIEAHYYLPPYEWYNDSISIWTKELGLELINYTYGTLSHTDYTTPDMKAYRSSKEIYNSIIEYEENTRSGLNGFILLFHIGTEEGRKDKFYRNSLEQLIKELSDRGYSFKRIDELLNEHS